MDYTVIALNIVKQIVLLVLNLYLIPYFTYFVVYSFGDPFPKWFSKIYYIPKSYTLGLLVDILKLPILFITGILGNPFTADIHLEKDKEDGSIELNWNEKTMSRNWYNPIMVSGRYLSDALHILASPALAILIFKFILPETFASVVSGLGQWAALSNGNPDMDYFINMWNVFRNLAWDRLVMVGLNENVILFGIFIFIVMLSSDTYISIINPETKDFTSVVYILPVAIVGITAYNFIHANYDYNTYTKISEYLGAVGMILLFVLLVRLIIGVILFCYKTVFTLIKKRIKG